MNGPVCRCENDLSQHVYQPQAGVFRQRRPPIGQELLPVLAARIDEEVPNVHLRIKLRAMIKVGNEVAVREGCTPEALPVGELLESGRPAVLKGLARSWGLVQAGLRSVDDAMSYLRSFYNGKVLSASFAAPETAGRLFYNADFTKLNFEARRTSLGEVLDTIRSHLDDAHAPTTYIGSTLVDSYLPGMRKENDLGFAAHGVDAPPTIWIGNRTVASCHYDAPNNIACVAVGRRRFTIFPPHQVINLYPGPMELNPGGQA